MVGRTLQRWALLGAALALAVTATAVSVAQTQPQPASQPTPAPPAAAPVPPPTAAAPPVAAAPAPNPIEAVNRANTELVVTLVRNTIAALGQANLTGNYTVLRDLGAPDFAAKNSATDLAAIFAPVRTAKIDLAPVVLLDPQISRASLTADKKLYITGALATQPLPITFELLFSPVNSIWRVDGLSITPVQSLAAPLAAAPSALLQKPASPAKMASPAPSAPRKKPTPKPPKPKETVDETPPPPAQ